MTDNNKFYNKILEKISFVIDSLCSYFFYRPNEFEKFDIHVGPYIRKLEVKTNIKKMVVLLL